MTNYKKTLWVNYLFTFLLAMAITLVLKVVFTPLLSEQQEQLIQKLSLDETPLFLNKSELSRLVEQNQFSYIKVTNQQLVQPLIYENKQATGISRFIFSTPATLVTSKSNQQLIEFKSKNDTLFALLKNILFAIYSLLIIVSTLISLNFYRMFKSVEIALIDEISETASLPGPYAKVSALLNECRKSLQSNLNEQKSQNESLQNSLNEHNEQNKSLQVSLNEQNEQNESLQNALNEQNKQNKSLQKRLNEQNESFQKCLNEHNEQNKSLQQRLNEQNESFQKRLNEQKENITGLTQQAITDNLTGVNNRSAFRKTLNGILSAPNGQKHAILSIIKASELQAINSQQGFLQGDLYLKNIAEIILKVTSAYQSISVYRINGADFAMIAPGMNVSEARRVAQDLKTQFDQYQAQHNLDSIAYHGISSIISGQLPEQVLSRTDLALAKAQTEGVNSWVFQQSNDNDNGNQFGQQHWQLVIQNIIAKKSITLLHQPILTLSPNMRGYEEVFTRFVSDDGRVIPADTVFAMAQRLDMIIKLEQIIIEKIIGQCHNKTDQNSRWGVNISNAVIQNSSFIVWLERLLSRDPKIASSLTFEMQKELLDTNIVSSKRVFDMLRRTGARTAISHFGKGIGSFGLFKTLKPDFVKIDSSLITNIEHDSENQQFVRTIIDVAHRMECRVIAEGVEHLAQQQILETMQVDGIQGYLIARPTELKTLAPSALSIQN